MTNRELWKRAEEAVRTRQRMVLKKDVVFKAFFANTTHPKEAEILRNSLISAVTGEKVTHTVVENPELMSDFVEGKIFRLDILCTLADGSQADLEMQVKSENDDQLKRTILYASRIHSNNIKIGEDYDTSKKTYQIMICDFQALPDKEYFHKFTFRTENGLELADTMQIYFLELGKLDVKKVNFETLNDVEFWSIMIKCSDDPEIMSRLKSMPRYKEVAEMADDFIDRMSQSEHDWWNQFSTETNYIWQQCRLAMARDNGIKQGLQQGSAQEKLETAKRMLKDGLTSELVSKYTGLAEQEIKSISL